MNVYIVESKIRGVVGAEWRPWDGRAHRCAVDAQAAKAKLEKKRTALVDYDFRVTQYAPSGGGES